MHQMRLSMGLRAADPGAGDPGVGYPGVGAPGVGAPGGAVLVLPAEGTLAVLRPPADADLSALPPDRLRIYTGFRPDHDSLARQGLSVAARPLGMHALALVCMQRSRDAARGLVADAAGLVPEGAPIVVDGQKTDGIEAMLRDLRGRVTVGAVLAKAHGKLFAFDNPGAAIFADWAAAAAPRVLPDGHVTRPGVFSADGVDRGSALLAAALPARLPRRVADIGAGWGVLSAAALSRDGVATIDLIEAEADALDCARLNITDPRARFHWADVTTFRLPDPVDMVLANPPFHHGRAADPGLGIAFITSAAAMLTPGGVLIMVANRHLPYEPALALHFRNVLELAGDSAFKVYRASHPLTRPAAAGQLRSTDHRTVSAGGNTGRPQSTRTVARTRR